MWTKVKKTATITTILSGLLIQMRILSDIKTRRTISNFFELHYFLNFPELETKFFELHDYASHQQLDVWVKVEPLPLSAVPLKCDSIKRQTPSNDERAGILGLE